MVTTDPGQFRGHCLRPWFFLKLVICSKRNCSVFWVSLVSKLRWEIQTGKLIRSEVLFQTDTGSRLRSASCSLAMDICQIQERMQPEGQPRGNPMRNKAPSTTNVK